MSYLLFLWKLTQLCPLIYRLTVKQNSSVATALQIYRMIHKFYQISNKLDKSGTILHVFSIFFFSEILKTLRFVTILA